MPTNPSLDRLSPRRPFAPRVALVILALVGVAQLVVPARQIFEREETLHKGTLYRFRTQPVDPYDAFRGRYVALGFADTSAKLPDELEVERRDRVYVTLTTDEEGFAQLGTVAKHRPSGDYLEARVSWLSRGSGEATIELPFDRYYMEEELAPEAESLYRAQARDARPAFAAVRVYRGRAGLEELFIDGLPVRERLEIGKSRPLLGGWYNHRAEGANWLHFALDNTATWTFENQDCSLTGIPFAVDYAVTPHTIDLGPFPAGPLEGRTLYGILELTEPNSFRVDFEPGSPTFEGAAQRPMSFADDDTQEYRRSPAPAAKPPCGLEGAIETEGLPE